MVLPSNAQLSRAGGEPTDLSLLKLSGEKNNKKKCSNFKAPESNLEVEDQELSALDITVVKVGVTEGYLFFLCQFPKSLVV